MAVTIIIKDGKPRGQSRTKMDRELRDQWGTTSFRNEGDADKAAYLERKIKKHFGADDSRVTAKLITDVLTDDKT
jgi:hypothetical protein